MSTPRTLRALVLTLNLALLAGIAAQGWVVVRGPQVAEERPYDAARYGVPEAIAPDRGLAIVGAELDRPLPVPAPKATLPPPTPQSPRPQIRLVAVLDDEEVGQARAAIVAFPDGSQRMVLPEGDLDSGGHWQVVKVQVEARPGGSSQGVITIEAGARVEHYSSDLSRVGG